MSQDNQMSSVQSIPIRCIHVESTHQFMKEEIVEYFGRFGVVKSLDIDSEDNTQYWLVSFNEIEAASKVLSNAAHRIADYDVEVKAAEVWQQPDYILNALNDHCLLECFEYLKFFDLVNAANVFRRFKQCARHVFAPKYNQIEMNTKRELLLFENIVVNFGSVIQCLKVKIPRGLPAIPMADLRAICEILELNFEIEEKNEYGIYQEAEVEIPDHPLRLINQYAHANLQKLELHNFESSESFGHLDTFSSLNYLEISRYCWIPNLHDLLKFCPKLEYLHINFLRVKRSDFSSLMRSIGENLQHLVELHLKLNIYGETLQNIHHLSNAKSLKKLKIRTDSRMVCWTAAQLMKGFVENHVPIEHIELDFVCFVDETIQSMSQLKQIKKIELIYCDDFTDDHLILLAKELPQLQSFGLTGDRRRLEITFNGLRTMIQYAKSLSKIELGLLQKNFQINLGDYYSILMAVKNRPTKISLSIHLTGHRPIDDMTKAVLWQNREYLDIRYLETN